MSLTFLILAVSLSLASTNDYVYTKPQNIGIAGSAAFGSDGLVRGEDVAFALEAAKERRAALTYVSTNEEYDASAILASKFNEAVGTKTNLIKSVGYSSFVRNDAELTNVVVLGTSGDKGVQFTSFVNAIGLVTTAEVHGVAVSPGASLSRSAVADLPSGLDKLTRVAFIHDGETTSAGYVYTRKWQYSGEPAESMDESTGEFGPGEFPADRTDGDAVLGISGEKGSRGISISGSRTKQQSWKSEYDGQHLKWVGVDTSDTGPAFESYNGKWSVRGGAQAFCLGVAARDSAISVTVAKIYAVCRYTHSKTGEIEDVKYVAVTLSANASTDSKYSEYHQDYLPRIVISNYGTDAIFDDVIAAFGEAEITTSSIAGKIPEPDQPEEPILPPQYQGEITSEQKTTEYEESQEVVVVAYIIVLDFDFNAKTL